MGHWHIDQQQPHRTENHHRRKFHALRIAADDQCRCDDCESHLEQHKEGFGDITSDRITTDAGQHHLAEISNQGASFAKSQAVPDDEPQDRGDAGNRKTLHQNREHVLGAQQTAVKERQPGQRHEQHQGG